MANDPAPKTVDQQIFLELNRMNKTLELIAQHLQRLTNSVQTIAGKPSF